MTRRPRVRFISVVPSPYQRDLFAALASRDDVEVAVNYMEAASPDSPWPSVPLRSFESILPGFWFPVSDARVHLNLAMPDLAHEDLVVLGSFSSTIGQRMLRNRVLRGRLLFWGERLRSQPSGWRRTTQRALIAPLAHIAGIVGIGKAASEDYAKRFPAPRHFCIPYYCDLSAFAAAARRPAEARLRFLFCGQMISRKGVDILLAAFHRLVTSGMNVELMLVGREAQLQTFLGGVSEDTRRRVLFEGFKPPEELPMYFSRCDVFVIPSRHDGWGVVVNQAIGAGMPVLASDAVGAGLDLVEHGVNGLRFPAGDVDALERCMVEIAKDRTKVAAWGQVSREKARELTPEAGAQRWVDVIQTIVGQP